MPYATKSTKTAETMLANYDDFFAQRQALGRDQKNRAKIDDLSRELDRKGKAIGAHLAGLMSDVTKNFGICSAAVDRWLGEAAAQFKRAEALLERPAEPGSVAEVRTIEKAIRTLGERAQDEAADFGKSWAALRGHNPTKGQLDAKYVKEFATLRATLMGDNKELVGKLARFETLAERCPLICRDLATAFTQRGELETRDVEDGIREAATDIGERWEECERRQHRMKTFRDRLEVFARSPKPDAAVIANMMGFVKDCSATIKATRDDHRWSVARFGSAEKSFKGRSPATDKQLGQLGAAVQKWVGAIGSMEQLLAELAQTTRATQARIKG